MGRFSEPVEKDGGVGGGGKLRRKLRLGRRKGEKEENEREPSTGSSSAVKRKRHLVSRWTRGNLRDSHDTVRSTSDSASIRSRRSGRRAALGDPRTDETVEVAYDGEGPTGESGEATHVEERSVSGNEQPHASDTANRPRSPPPPHPDSSHPRRTASSTSETTTSLQSPRRVLLDDSDFQAADAAEATHHMPPAYIPASSSSSNAQYSGAALAAALSRGDAKHGIPPPEQRDPEVSPEVIRAVLADREGVEEAEEEERGPTQGHIATDDKAVLGALSAAASMPSAPAGTVAVAGAREISAPAYGAAEGGSSSSAPLAGPSAPTLEVDGEGFEVASTPASTSEKQGGSAGKGKAKQFSPPSALGLLPAPPAAVEQSFSPFDQPYRPTHPPSPAAVPSTPPAVMSARKSEKQKEAEGEAHLAELVASRPEAASVPEYHASAPAMEGEEVEGVNLPAYEQQRRSSSAAGVAAPSAPSAPLEEDEE